MEYVKFEKLLIKNNPNLNEKWVQDRISEDPGLLNLGDVVLKDKERIQPRAGRLDLLLQDAEANRRYEVEIQLGSIDESHIILTIEYWDIERKRYPQYEHVAAIVAEDMTSRFLNVINLDDAARQINKYVDFYNKRLHSSLYYLTPADFLYGRVDEKIRVREEKLRRAKLARFKTRLAS